MAICRHRVCRYGICAAVDAINPAGMIRRPMQTVGAMAPASAGMPRISVRTRTESAVSRHATG